FIHRCYIESAREFWKNPSLIDKIGLTSGEKQHNMRESLKLIENSIIDTVGKLLPVQAILLQYLNVSGGGSISNEIPEGVTSVPEGVTSVPEGVTSVPE